MIQGPIALMEANTAVQSAVGRNKANTKYKIYWVQCPDTEEQPYYVLAIQSNNPTNYKGESSSFDRVQFAVIAYAGSPEKCNTMDVAARAALEVIDTTAGDVHFHRIFFVTQADGYDADARLPYRASIYEAQFERQIPT
jgi:hypothetical protein